ncbi:MAG: alkaline phosphatase family protein [Bacteroidota bacterium]|nr:alkaline phosphatase family protein [Bacteroidota bacterium]MDP3144007.1 alkaline phosphatase family protein [Bacteroidota bacterium]
MKNYFLNLSIYLLVVISSTSYSQTIISSSENTKPKLVVGIVVDQMRNDYIYRYWNRYSNGGFKRLINSGYYFRNAHFNYIPTYTGPGHSSIYSGAFPRTHGIIANDWFVKTSGVSTYCCEDSEVKTVGSPSKNGLMSPKNLLSSTIGDELKMSSNQRAKVFSIALKDRSAILPAGHAANAAFWFDDSTGNFISSTWYTNTLPKWLINFNAKNLTKSYLEKGWSTLYPIETYTNSIADENKYEAAPNKKEKAIFPYEYKSFLDKNKYAILKATPHGNSITKDIAIECLINEQLGKDDEADLFCISFSSTDIVAHSYGPRAIEVEDIYLRLDKEIEDLLNALDKEVGKDNYTVFLTADHGGADVPNHLLDNKISAGYLKEEKIIKKVKHYFQNNYGDSLLLATICNEQVYLNDKKLEALKLNKEEVEEKLSDFLITIKGISEAYPSKVLKNEAFEKADYRALLQNGYNHKLSGNVCFIYNAAWMDYSEKGTTHGAGYNYDTHVPVLFYGKGIKKGESFNYITITQIAPTICELLKINQPNSTIAQPLNDFFK